MVFLARVRELAFVKGIVSTFYIIVNNYRKINQPCR